MPDVKRADNFEPCHCCGSPTTLRTSIQTSNGKGWEPTCDHGCIQSMGEPTMSTYMFMRDAELNALPLEQHQLQVAAALFGEGRG